MNKFEVFSTTKFLVRLRSDNRLQLYMMSPGGACWTCDETVPQLHTWTDFTPPPLPIDAVPVRVLFFETVQLYVAYSDGSVFRAQIIMDQLPGGTNCEDGEYCVLTLGEWSPLP